MPPPVEFGPMGLGTWSWGDDTGWGSGPSQRDLEEAFTASVDAGISLIDTAERYGGGEAERLLGMFIARHHARVKIATKFSPLRQHWRRAHLRTALAGSLRRLGLDRIDLYQIHWPTRFSSIPRWMDALADAASEGLIGAAGVSNYTPEQARCASDALAKRGVRLAAVQVRYNLLQRAPEANGMHALCRERGMTLLAYSPLAMGLLSGTYGPRHPPAGSNRSAISPRQLASLAPLSGLMREIGAAHGHKNPAQVALNWVMRKGAVPLAGARNAAQAAENAGSRGWDLGPDEMTALETAAALAGGTDGRG